MDWGILVEGYRNILNTIYSPKNYYERINTFLHEYRPPRRKRPVMRPHEVWPVLKALWVLGVKEKGQWHFWKSLVTTLLKYPSSIREFVTAAVYGLHFRKVAEEDSHSLG